MDYRAKVFIVYASAGAGHLKAAQAIYDCLKKRGCPADIRLVDILDETNFWFSESYTFGYRFLVNHAIFLWRFCFLTTYAKALRIITRPIAMILNRFSSKKFSQYLVKENPDVIVSTHFVPSEIASILKKKKKIKSFVVSVITDYGVHPYWISPGTDLYIAGSSVTLEKIVHEGVPRERIKALGIPVNEKFLKKFNKNALCEKFGIRCDGFTVLLLTGSFGIGPVEEMVELLQGKVQILAVCARNRGLYEKLQRRNFDNCRAFGFVDNIEELMAVSDMIITKPGGISISEALAMDLYPIFISPIPGQETENVEVMARYGVGILAKDIDSVEELVLGLKDDPERLKELRGVVAKVKKPMAAEEICNVVCESFAGPCC
ncbi:MAG: hypothetical protein KJ880_05175 [Candidatus Omnitrophica bacterium]|nr:hypothetical protein [Candidatus Omnitrophota bacterium]MBU1869523.1 hypothetical protein [Candidatus Omnitrophota bacterium]